MKYMDRIQADRACAKNISPLVNGRQLRIIAEPIDRGHYLRRKVEQTYRTNKAATEGSGGSIEWVLRSDLADPPIPLE
ncbi:hypothetical protein [Bifidobacterium miconisargentati]|uniref:hypothetical protein n=1 Tax=Bifidobacterium miconisargentati TaxID=2834437 RepID=UPI001BDDA6D5|nr:hypothetical protein [Bifidobacterium miconisargentati]MBW3089213.1 hypothetical protein [Bifidobacterium miconisargentati]